MSVNGYGVSFQGDENVLKLHSDDYCTSLNIQKAIEFYTLTG